MVSVSPAARLVYDVSCSDLTLTGISIAHRSLTQHQPRHHCTRHREYFRPFPKCQLSHKHVAPSLPRHTPLRSPSVLSERLPEQRALWTLQIDRDWSCQRNFAKFHSTQRRPLLGPSPYYFIESAFSPSSPCRGHRVAPR